MFAKLLRCKSTIFFPYSGNFFQKKCILRPLNRDFHKKGLLTAREQSLHHARVNGLLDDRYPLLAREHPVPDRRVLQMHVAHLAVQVAQRCQLEIANIRDICLAGLLLYHRQEFSVG